MGRLVQHATYPPGHKRNIHFRQRNIYSETAVGHTQEVCQYSRNGHKWLARGFARRHAQGHVVHKLCQASERSFEC